MVTLVHWILASLSLMVMAYVVPGVHITNFFAALFAALIIGLVNIFIWPVLVFLTLPLTILTFGFFLFVVNGMALLISAALAPGFYVEGFLPAIVGSIVLTLVGSLVRHLFRSAAIQSQSGPRQ